MHPIIHERHQETMMRPRILLLPVPGTDPRRGSAPRRDARLKTTLMTAVAMALAR